MDPRLLPLYDRERLYMQALGGEFALGHPKIARRLLMFGSEAGD
ncbi:type VI secretion system baseplate subunit TssF, partial [Caballeronia grimmiae]